jgi:hypothetical protein
MVLLKQQQVVLFAGTRVALIVSCTSSRPHNEQGDAVPPIKTVGAASPVESTRRVIVAARIVEVMSTSKRHQSYIFVAIPEDSSLADATARYVFELYQDFGGRRAAGSTERRDA